MEDCSGARDSRAVDRKCCALSEPLIPGLAKLVLELGDIDGSKFRIDDGSSYSSYRSTSCA